MTAHDERERNLLRGAVLDAVSGRRTVYLDTSADRAAATARRWATLRRELRVDADVPLLRKVAFRLARGWLERQALAHAVDVIVVDDRDANLHRADFADWTACELRVSNYGLTWTQGEARRGWREEQGEA